MAFLNIVIMNKREHAIAKIKEYIEIREKRLQVLQEIANDNMNRFIRSYSEEYYKFKNEVDKFQAIQNVLETKTQTDESAMEFLRNIQNDIKDYLVRNHPMESSSSPMACLTSVWECEVKQKIFQLIEFCLL